jgi:hypothetical protein
MKKMNFTKLSRLGIIVSVAILLVIDIPAIISETEGDTVSEQMYLLAVNK